MADKQQIDDIISMLDQFMEQGGGHMNIQVDDPDNLNEIKVDTFKSNDCCSGNSACSAPTLLQSTDVTE